MSGLVGIDWKCKAIYDGAQRVSRLGLQNIALIHGRGQSLPDIFGNREIDELWIFHPEPFEKETKSQARLISLQFLRQIEPLLRGSDSCVVLKTDHADYYQQVLKLLRPLDSNSLHSSAAPFEVTVASTDFWKDPRAQLHTSKRSFKGEMTEYERRFSKRHVPIHYLEFRKIS